MIDELRWIKTVLGFVAYCSPLEGGINTFSCLTFALNIEIVEEDVGKLRLRSVLLVLCESEYHFWKASKSWCKEQTPLSAGLYLGGTWPSFWHFVEEWVRDSRNKTCFESCVDAFVFLRKLSNARRVLVEEAAISVFIRARHSLPVSAYACCAMLRSVTLCSARSNV